MKQDTHRYSGLAKKSHTESTELKRKGRHKDWRVWLAVILLVLYLRRSRKHRASAFFLI
jgi:hypothetical protein